jgi:hypothetical protein
MVMEIQVSLCKYKYVAGLNRLMGSHPLFLILTFLIAIKENTTLEHMKQIIQNYTTNLETISSREKQRESILL